MIVVSSGFGSVEYWSKVTKTSHASLRDAWQQFNLPEVELPEAPTPVLALKYALGAFTHQGRTELRQIKGRESGYVIVEVTYPDGRPVFRNTFEVVLDGTNLRCTSAAYDAAIQKAYTVALATIHQPEMSRWLVSLVRGVDGLALRDGGGFYFVPGHEAHAWGLRKAAISTAMPGTIQFSSIPAMKTDEAIESVVAALEAEASACCQRIDADLADAKQARKVLARQSELRELSDRLSRFEQVLGTKLTSVRASIDAVQLRAAEVGVMAS